MWLLTVCSISPRPRISKIFNQTKNLLGMSFIHFIFKNEKAPSLPNVSSEWHEPVHHSYCHLLDHK